MAAERGSYTFDIMVDEFVTFVVAGMETTANSLALCMMELARRPDLVERFVLQTNITQIIFKSEIPQKSS